MSDIDKLALEIAEKVFDVGGDTRSLCADVARLGILEGERRGMEKAAVIAPDVLDFLMGIGPLEGCQFGERHPTRKGAFWWRTVLRERSEMLKQEAIRKAQP